MGYEIDIVHVTPPADDREAWRFLAHLKGSAHDDLRPLNVTPALHNLCQALRTMGAIELFGPLDGVVRWSRSAQGMVARVASALGVLNHRFVAGHLSSAGPLESIFVQHEFTTVSIATAQAPAILPEVVAAAGSNGMTLFDSN